jgi:hypothetical protein
MLGFQFHGRSNVQRVESPHSQPRRVSVGQFRTNFECPIKQGRLPPQILGAMLLEALQQTVSLAPRNSFAEYVLFDGVRPLGHVQGCHP